MACDDGKVNCAFTRKEALFQGAYSTKGNLYQQFVGAGHRLIGLSYLHMVSLGDVCTFHDLPLFQNLTHNVSFVLTHSLGAHTGAVKKNPFAKDCPASEPTVHQHTANIPIILVVMTV